MDYGKMLNSVFSRPERWKPRSGTYPVYCSTNSRPSLKAAWSSARQERSDFSSLRSRSSLQRPQIHPMYLQSTALTRRSAGGPLMSNRLAATSSWGLEVRMAERNLVGDSLSIATVWEIHERQLAPAPE